MTGKNHLSVAHCGNRTCSRGNTITIDRHPDGGYWSSVAIGADKRPLISYDQIGSNDQLKVLHCGNRACTAGNTSTAVANSSRSSLAIGRDGLPLLAYDDETDGPLMLLHCGNRACITGNTKTTISDRPGDPSLTIGRDGLPLISYLQEATPSESAGLELLHCGNRTCTTGNSTTNAESTQGHATGPLAIAIGADGRPVLSHFFGSDLKVLHCGNRTCSSGDTDYLVDGHSPFTAGTTPALAIGADGLPVLSYVVGRSLKVLHCGNISCRPHLQK